MTTLQTQLFIFSIATTIIITWYYFYRKETIWNKRIAGVIIFILGLYTTTADLWVTDGTDIIQPLAYILILISISIILKTTNIQRGTP